MRHPKTCAAASQENFGPIPEKFTDLERFKAGFPAIIGNFAVGIAHIREALSSEQFCVSPADACAVMAGLFPAIHASPRGTKNADARDKPGHDDVEALALHIQQIRPLTPTHGAMRPRGDASVN